MLESTFALKIFLIYYINLLITCLSYHIPLGTPKHIPILFHTTLPLANIPSKNNTKNQFNYIGFLLWFARFFETFGISMGYFIYIRT